MHGPNLITLFTGNCQVETLVLSDIIIDQNKTFLLSSLTQQTRQIKDYEQSFFLLLAVYDKQWSRSVSCEYTKPLVVPHQTQWSQRTEQSPA